MMTLVGVGRLLDNNQRKHALQMYAINRFAVGRITCAKESKYKENNRE